MNKQQLATKIWESANRMRSKIEANDYKDYILGFIFYKYLSDRELAFMIEQGAVSEEEQIQYLQEEDVDSVRYLQEHIGYFIGYNNLFSTWIKQGQDFDISHVRDGLSAFARLIGANYKSLFRDIFDTLETGLSKLGDTAASQTKAVRDLIYLIDEIPMDGKQDYDVLGFIYEYLISNFAANAGKKAGEFYTPQEVSLLMSQIIADFLKERDVIQIYDPTSGSGSLLLNIGRSVAKYTGEQDKIKYYAQELKQNTYNLTRMNLVMRGIKPDNIHTRNADTLEEDWPYFDENDPANTYEPLYVDAVVSNPPYSQRWDPEGKESDPRYSRFGLAPKSKADYAFLLHDLYHLKPDGIMTIVLPHGVLFRGGEEGTIRKNLIENNHIDTIIGLPANIFFGTGIPTIVMVLKQKRANTDVLIVDASKGFAKVGKNNVLRASDIRKIVDTVISRQDVNKFARAVSREEIRSNDYNLNIPRYVDSSPPAESWDLHASMFGGIPAADIADLQAYWDALPGLKDDLFVVTDGGSTGLSTNTPVELITNHPAVSAFINQFESAFAGFEEHTQSRLVANRDVVRVAAEEDVLADDIFGRLQSLPLVDKYRAFQLMHDQWEIIALDLEMLQTEGADTVRRVDPNMVIKKRRGKDTEVQEGWIGRIFPFDLVQDQLLQEETRVLHDAQDRLSAVDSEIDEITEGLSEEDKADLAEVLNDDNTAFLSAPLNRAVKEINKEVKAGELVVEDESAERICLNVKKLMDEKRGLGKQIKEGDAALHLLTKEIIEQLTDSQVEELLALKWVVPIREGLLEMPHTIVADLSAKVVALADKYETTLADLDEEIAQVETELAEMLGDLVGSDADMEALEMFRGLLAGEG